MNWTGVVLIAGVVVGIAAVKRVGLVSARQARVLLRQGAMVIDVRTPTEYEAGHLPETTSIPLDQLSDQVGGHAPDKNQPLLLHCLSGVRSGMGRRMLRQLGYSSVHNLGSYRRAAKILRPGRPPGGRPLP
jgi:phage shock protein E